MNPAGSEGFNPLDAILQGLTDPHKFSALMYSLSQGNESKEKFWEASSTNLSSIIIRILLFYPHIYFTLAGVRYLLILLNSDPVFFNQIAVTTRNKKLIDEVKAFLTIADNTKQSIIASTLAMYEFVADEKLQLITSQSTFSFQEFRTKASALFVQSPSVDVEFYKPFTSLLFHQCYAALLAEPVKPTDLSCFFLIDELGSLYLRVLPEALRVQRKARIGSMLAIQDESVLSAYGKQAQSIITNCNKIYLPGQSPEMANQLEKMLGQTEFHDSDGHVRVRPLMSAGQINRMEDKAICLISKHSPELLTLTPYFKTGMRKLTSLPPTPITKKLGDSIPLLTKEYIQSLNPVQRG
jgi:type IV secretory pathway TraG/TraD family ATPase VirD4